MKLFIGDTVIAHERFETHADLVDRFREHEASRGRVPPAFMWEALLTALAVFIAEYLGEKALDHAWEWSRRKDNAKMDASKILTDVALQGGAVRVILETRVEAEIIEQLRDQLPGVEIVSLST